MPTSSSHTLPLLLEPEDLAELLPLDGVLIIDQCKAETFLEHHIPGAVHLDFKRLQLGVAPTPGALPSNADLSAVFSELGLTPDTHVVCSDDEGGGWAGRLIWVLDSIGHKQYSYLNGGIVAWLDAGLPTESGASIPTASEYVVDYIDQSVSITKEQIKAALGSSKFAIWDARSPAEYSGEKAISPRGGHIPTAVNYEWTLGMDKSRALRIKELNTFKTQLAEMGLDKNKTIATHCQTHHRSGFTYLVGKILGLTMRAYAGSWAEWGSDTTTPVTTGKKP
ncbi:MAG: rhodanese-like domain-containing protein [Thalassolituus sp.]|uniref:sulfurtransferase n=1 Tax=Thalassolituus sp. TaxID=2030822 RepID=UPI00398225D3